LDDYLVVNPNDGSVDVYWNHGPNQDWANGWEFVPAGQIASGVPFANLVTLRFPDINGDGRADYVVIGKGGSLGMWLNTGTAGGQDVLFLAQGGIATGASPNISNLVFADVSSLLTMLGSSYESLLLTLIRWMEMDVMVSGMLTTSQESLSQYTHQE
jgi:hypothetical protein